jgi:hypothetical protein
MWCNVFMHNAIKSHDWSFLFSLRWSDWSFLLSINSHVLLAPFYNACAVDSIYNDHLNIVLIIICSLCFSALFSLLQKSWCGGVGGLRHFRFWLAISWEKCTFFVSVNETLGLTHKFWYAISSINILSGMVRTCLYILGSENKLAPRVSR